jgi:flavin reductase (DIM6/NTAB) family NADH-FMN oxidoreductase RutF
MSQPHDAAVAAARFRNVIRHLASGVTVITASLAGEPVGMTATAVCSVSATPPSVLVCLQSGARTALGVAESGFLGIHLLRHAGRKTAEQFASRGEHFTSVNFEREPQTGVPLLSDVLAWLVCAVEQAIPAADHTIFVARVLDCELKDRAPDPLLYFDRSYRQLASGAEPATQNLEPWGSAQDTGLPGWGWP